MLPNLLVKAELRRRHGAVADILPAVIVTRMGGPDDIAERREIPRPFAQNRMPDIDMIAIHVGACG